MNLNNATCDVYRLTGEPPEELVKAGVPCFLTECYDRFLESGEHGASGRFTHLLLVDAAEDVRGDLTSCDLVYVPNVNGTRFVCLWSEITGPERRCYLDRQPPTWPTNEV